jgi:hypothetical protein
MGAEISARVEQIQESAACTTNYCDVSSNIGLDLGLRNYLPARFVANWRCLGVLQRKATASPLLYHWQ